MAVITFPHNKMSQKITEERDGAPLNNSLEQQLEQPDTCAFRRTWCMVPHARFPACGNLRAHTSQSISSEAAVCGGRAEHTFFV